MSRRNRQTASRYLSYTSNSSSTDLSPIYDSTGNHFGYMDSTSNSSRILVYEPNDLQKLIGYASSTSSLDQFAIYKDTNATKLVGYFANPNSQNGLS